MYTQGDEDEWVETNKQPQRGKLIRCEQRGQLQRVEFQNKTGNTRLKVHWKGCRLLTFLVVLGHFLPVGSLPACCITSCPGSLPAWWIASCLDHILPGGSLPACWITSCVPCSHFLRPWLAGASSCRLKVRFSRFTPTPKTRLKKLVICWEVQTSSSPWPNRSHLSWM